MQQDKRSTHLQIFTSLYFFQPLLSSAPSDQLRFLLRITPGRASLKYSMNQDTWRDVVWRQRGDRGYPPIHDVIKKTGTEVLPVYIINHAHSFLSKYSMDSNKCLWCSDEFFAYRHYTKCCGKLYHYGCLLRNTSAIPPEERFCPNCKAVNLGEPFKLLPHIKNF